MRLASVALVLALACGGGEGTEDATELGTSGAEVEAPPPPLDPLALLPFDSLGVTTVDVDRLRTSPYYATIRAWLDLVPDLSSTQREAIDTVIASSDIAHVSVVDRPCSRKCWTLASIFVGSAMEPSAARATMQQLAAGESFAPREVAGYPAFGDAQGAMVTVESGKYLVGPDRYIEPPLTQPQRPRAESDAAVASAVQALAGTASMVRGWVIGDETTQALLARESPFSSELTALIRGVAYHVDLSDGLVVDTVSTTADPASAVALSDAARREIDALTGSLPARAMGLGVMGQSTQVGVQNDQVRVTLRLSDDQLRPLLARADAFLRLVN